MVFFCFHIYSEHQDAPFSSHACAHLLHLSNSSASMSLFITLLPVHQRPLCLLQSTQGHLHLIYPQVLISHYPFPLYEVRWVLKLVWNSPCFNVRRSFSTDLLCNLERPPILIIVGGFIQQMPDGGCAPIMFSSCLSLKSIEFCPNSLILSLWSQGDMSPKEYHDTTKQKHMVNLKGSPHSLRQLSHLSECSSSRVAHEQARIRSAKLLCE